MYELNGAHALAANDYQTAIGIFTEASERVRPDAAGFNGRGVIYYDLGQLDLALSDFERALALEPQFASAHFNRAMALARSGDYAGALVDFDEAARIGSRVGLTSYVFPLGQCLGRVLAAQELVQAQSHCNRAASRSRGAAVTLVARGFLHVRENDYEAAANDFRAAIDEDRFDAAAVFGRGLISIRQGNMPPGQEDIAQAVGMNRQSVDFYRRAGLDVAAN